MVDRGLAVEAFDPSGEFFNERNSTLDLKSEKPEHTRMLLLKFNGMSNAEIAILTGYTREHVGHVMRQPWARKRLIMMFDEAGTDFSRILEQEAKESILTLSEIRQDEKMPASARVAASINLADRFFGKPTQRVETYDGGKAPSLKTLDSIEAEITKTQDQIKQLENSR